MITNNKISKDMKNKLNYFAFFLLIIISAFLLPFVNALSVAVSPSSLDFNIELGKTGEENIFIINYDEQEANYEIYVENYKDWFSFSSTSISVAGGKNEMVKVNVTPNKTGEFETLIYVKVTLQENGGGVGVAPGIGIKTKINITEPEPIVENPPTPTPVNTGSGGGSGSSGGGGDGGSIPPKTTTQTTNSTNSSQTTTESPQNTDVRTEESEIKENSEKNQENQNAPITGAVIGGGKRTIGIAIAFVVLLIGITISVYNKRKNKIIG